MVPVTHVIDRRIEGEWGNEMISTNVGNLIKCFLTWYGDADSSVSPVVMLPLMLMAT